MKDIITSNMGYRGKRVAVTGCDSFIGSHLITELEILGAEVIHLTGDTRNPETFEDLDYTYDYLFHFAAPSSQVLFKRMPNYCIETTLVGFMNAAKAAKYHGIRLVYPSTGLLSTGEANEYARCKKICEDWAAGNNADTIGLRIFATYGPGESHKADYASVPYLFARDIVVNGKAPVIYGDGTQVRDFIYINDVVQSILHAAEECPDPILDIGSGKESSFKHLVKLINLKYFGDEDDSEDRWIKPVHIDKPSGYVNLTTCDPVRLYDFYTPQVSLFDGVERLVDHLRKERNNQPNAMGIGKVS